MGKTSCSHCGGDGIINQAVDISDYEGIECAACKGAGHFNNPDLNQLTDNKTRIMLKEISKIVIEKANTIYPSNRFVRSCFYFYVTNEYLTPKQVKALINLVEPDEYGCDEGLEHY